MSATRSKMPFVDRRGYAGWPIELSIVTVTFNDSEGLHSTIKSLMECGSARFELVIVEGAVPARGFAQAVLEELSPAFPVTVIQGHDDGPYDAMNRGILSSSGNWLWFMNSGDEFAPNIRMSDIESMLLSCPSPWLVGRARVGHGDTIRVKGYQSAKDLLAGRYTPCHQSIIVRREAFLTYGLFDVRFRISADYDFMCKLGRIIDPYVTSQVLTHYLGGGISDKRIVRREFESATIRVRSNWGVIAAPKEYLRFLVRAVRALRV